MRCSHCGVGRPRVAALPWTTVMVGRMGKPVTLCTGCETLVLRYRDLHNNPLLVGFQPVGCDCPGCGVNPGQRRVWYIGTGMDQFFLDEACMQELAHTLEAGLHELESPTNTFRRCILCRGNTFEARPVRASGQMVSDICEPCIIRVGEHALRLLRERVMAGK